MGGSKNGKLQVRPSTAKEILDALGVSKEERKQALEILIKLFGDEYRKCLDNERKCEGE